MIEHVGRHESKLKGLREKLEALKLHESEARAQLDKFEKKIGAHRNITAHRSASQPTAGAPARKKRPGRPSRTAAQSRAPPPTDSDGVLADSSADGAASALSNPPSTALCASAPATFDGGGPQGQGDDGGMAHGD